MKQQPKPHHSPAGETTRPFAGESSDPSISHRGHRCDGAHRGCRGQGAPGEKYFDLVAFDDNHGPFDSDVITYDGNHAIDHAIDHLVAHRGVGPIYWHPTDDSEHDPSDHDHDESSAHHNHDPSGRHFRGHVAMTEIAAPHALFARLTAHSFRPIATTAFVVVVPPDQAECARACRRIRPYPSRHPQTSGAHPSRRTTGLGHCTWLITSSAKGTHREH